MPSYRVLKKDGTELIFNHAGRAGGSFTKELRYLGAFAVIVDEWGNETAIPAADIERIESRSERQAGFVATKKR
jgi:hypothetical protein